MRFAITVSLAAGCALLAGCASDGQGLLTTASVPKKEAVATVDPACLALQNRIALLRQEGTVGRVEKAAAGKSKTVVIKRAALAKVAELNQANSEFRSRCSKLPVQTAKAPTAAVTPQQAAATVASAARTANTTATTARTTAEQVKAVAERSRQ